jgi:hypothetical protein
MPIPIYDYLDTVASNATAWFQFDNDNDILQLTRIDQTKQFRGPGKTLFMGEWAEKYRDKVIISQGIYSTDR